MRTHGRQNQTNYIGKTEPLLTQEYSYADTGNPSWTDRLGQQEQDKARTQQLLCEKEGPSEQSEGTGKKAEGDQTGAPQTLLS